MTIEFHYTESILKQAIGDYIKRGHLKQFIELMVLSVVVLICAFFINEPWVQAFTVVLIVTIPLLIVMGYWMRIRESLKRFRLLEDGKALITLDESGVKFESAVGKSEIKWHIFTKLWEFPAEYLLFYSNNQFLTLPRSQVSPEFIEFIRKHLKQA